MKTEININIEAIKDFTIGEIVKIEQEMQQ